MSSINASDRSRYTDEVRNQREEYQNREAENVKKQKKEIRRLNEAHDKEIQQVKESYEEKIDDLRGRSKEQLTEKDQQNIAKIEGLRKLYADSMAKKQSESEDLRASQGEALRSQLEKEREIHQSQKDVLQRQFRDSLEDKSREFETFSTQSREDLQSTIKGNREQLNKKHQVEMEQVVKDRDMNTRSYETKLADQKSQLENRMKNQDAKSQLEKNRIDGNWQTHYKNKEMELGELDKRRSQELKWERLRMRDQYEDVFAKKRESLNKSFEQLQDNVNDRIDNEVRVTKQENQRLKAGEVARGNTLRRLTDLEKKELVYDYENRMKNLRGMNKEQIDEVRELNKKRIDFVNDRNSEALQSATQRFKSEQIINNDRHGQDRDRLINEKQSAVDSVKIKTEDRIEKILKGANESQRVQVKLHNEGLNSLKDSYQNELVRQREGQLEQLKETYARMESRLKESDLKGQKKLDTTVVNYENKINQIKEQYEGQLKNQEQSFENRLVNQKKEFDRNLKTEEIKNQAKLEDMKSVHEKEIDRIERRHQEQQAALVQKMSYYSKKS